MCSRYYFDNDTMNDILNIVKETDARLQGMPVNRDIYPTDNATVIIRNAGGIKLSKIKWGYPGINGSGIIINARAESVLDKKMYEGGIKRRRAVIPARCFYEWSRSKEKNTFHRKDRNTIYMSKGEYISVKQAVGGIENLFDENCKDKDALALVKYISDENKDEKILENQKVLKTAIVRNGKQATVGYQPEIWKTWK